MIDCIYVAASKRDGRFTRICVASIRHFYPRIPVKLLAGGPLQPGLARELVRFWDVRPANVTQGDYGWGFVKLEPLFGPAGERFLVLDSDTVMAGPVLEAWTDDAPFLVDEERLSESDICRLYYDWRKLRVIDSAAVEPAFAFNSGQWFGTAGLVTREDFAPWVTWTMPRRLRHPDVFMPGEQGVLNYVLNKKAASGALAVARRKIMCWPDRSMAGVSAETIANGTAPPLIVHWAGLKKPRVKGMTGADVLLMFERSYYRRVPMSGVRRMAALARHFEAELALRARLRLARLHVGSVRSPS